MIQVQCDVSTNTLLLLSFILCTQILPECLVAGITVTQQQQTLWLSRFSFIKAVCKQYLVTFHFFFPSLVSKLFLKHLCCDNKPKSVPVTKLLVYPIRQGLWMNVMRTQHESVMKAITHCQERWAPNAHLQPCVSYLFRVTFGRNTASSEMHGAGNEKQKRRKRLGSHLTEGGNRQLAASFGSRGCQSWRDDGDWKWVKKKEIILLRDRAQFRILEEAEIFLLIQKLKTSESAGRGIREREESFNFLSSKLLQPFTPSFPSGCQEPALCCFCSHKFKKHEDPSDVVEGCARSRGGGGGALSLE